MDEVERVLGNCTVNYSSEDYSLIDTTLFDLESCNGLLSVYLSTMLYVEPLPTRLSEEVVCLRSLHRCLDELQVIWKLKMMKMDDLSDTWTRGGRPPKKINIELVRGCDCSSSYGLDIGMHTAPVYKQISFHFQLEFLREMKMTWSRCADVLMVSRTTLWRRCLKLGLTRMQSELRISDNELDAIMLMLVQRFPNCGSVMMWGHLRGYGLTVPRSRVRESLLRVSPRLVELRTSTAVVRRRYNVASSNALWHIDGLHCLIRWRIVIHGGIDGYSRQVVYLHASGNNKATTVFQLFLSATQIYGWPSRVRSDCGGENIEVARAMLLSRGVDRASHITGSSVHNQRIERLWRDVFNCVCHTYYSLFYEMEDSGLLNPLNE